MDGWGSDEFQNISPECIKVAACTSDLKNGLARPNTYLFFHNYVSHNYNVYNAYN